MNHISYPSAPFDEDLYVRYLTPEDEKARLHVQDVAFTRVYLEPGYVDKERLERHKQRLATSGEGVGGGPTDRRYTGVFRRSSSSEELVAFQTWGTSSYEYPQPSMQMHLALNARGGINDFRPAYIQDRCMIEPGRGYGTLVRHAAALQMEGLSFTSIGHKICEFNWYDHIDEIAALEPVQLRREWKEVSYFRGGLNPHALNRTELYVSIASLRDYLERRKPWLTYVEAESRQLATESELPVQSRVHRFTMPAPDRREVTISINPGT